MTPPWRSVLYLFWAATSLAWLFVLANWVVLHSEEAMRSWPLVLGTLWAGGFFVHLVSRR